ncbi:uncharacterized protein LOC132736836 [Ruditapes philippinarum]|uniref:uncharacterized protein LOC132736836 n=1 Tax=Ruditapes philippinarum TaxID=129788 RepID=UPI00295C1F2B|nr:uncharacterized protein LOC132736836 [Ruditapes philippinarum]
MSAEKILSNTQAKRLIPPSELASLVTALPDKAKAIEALLGQVDLAKRSKKKGWAKGLARELDKLQFHSHSWISQYVHELPATKKLVWKEDPTGTSKDIRLAIDPSIQVIRSDCGTKSHTSSESIALLDEFDMEVEVESGDERKLLASPPCSPLKPKPVSPVKPIVRASSPRKSWAEAMELEVPLTLVATAAPPSSETVTITQSAGPEGLSESSPKAELACVAASPAKLSQEKASASSDQPKGQNKDPKSRRNPSGQNTRRSHYSGGERLDRRRPAPTTGDHGSAPKEKHSRVVPASVPKTSRCPVPGCCGNFTQKHAMEAHLPGVFWLCVSGESVTNRRIGALKLVVRWLLGFSSTLLNLVVYLESVGVPVSHETCSSDLQRRSHEFLLRLYALYPRPSQKKRG